MSNTLKDAWEQELKKSLKVEALPQFIKKISGNHGISPFSIGRSDELLQASSPRPQRFLAIQNYNDLVRCDLSEWIHHPDVGLRFRQLQDIPQDENLRNKQLFLSQPFLFVPNDEQQQTLQFLNSVKARINLGWSPLSFGLTRGEILKKPLRGLEKVVASESLQSPSATWFYLSSAPYQWAGAQPHAELGILIAVSYEILRELDGCKMALADALKKISFGLSLGTDVVVEPAKVVALKLLMRRLVELLDSDLDFISPSVYAMPSLRVYSGRQPLNNLIRNVMMCSSAIIGGAEGFKCIPYDVLNKNKKADALRESTNVPLLLCNEAHLQDVVNPLDGSPLFAEATRTLCDHAWEFFKEIEKKGGIFEAVRTGWLQMELSRQSDMVLSEVLSLETALVGVNEFVDKRFHYGELNTSESSLIALENIIDPLFLDKTNDEYMSVQPLLISSLPFEWERLQEVVGSFKKNEIVVVKVASPGTDKKMRLLTKTMDVICASYKIIDDSQVSTEVKTGEVVVVVVADSQKEAQIVGELKALGGVYIVSYFSGKSSDATHLLSEDSTAFVVAEKIVDILTEAQS